MSRLSGLGREVLDVLATQPTGETWMSVLTTIMRRRHSRPVRVMRASLSRTLRRLWRDGLVELGDRYGKTLTEKHVTAREHLALDEADPEGRYKGALTYYGGISAMLGRPFRDPWGSADEFLQRSRTHVPSLRVRRVRITDAGRKRLTIRPCAKLTASNPDTVSGHSGRTVRGGGGGHPLSKGCPLSACPPGQERP